MSRPLVATEESTTLPVLIIDREGSIGLGLFEHLKQFLQVVLISTHEPRDGNNLLFIQFARPFPRIPEEMYSHIFYRVETKSDLSYIPEQLITKAKHEGTTIVFLVDSNFPAKDIDTLGKQHARTMVIVLGDMFGQPIYTKQSKIWHIFSQAKKQKRIHLTHSGLTEIRPVWYPDVLKELIQLSFANKAIFGVFLLYPPFTVAEIGMCHALQQIDPLLTIDVSKEGEKPKKGESIQGVFVLPPTYAVFEKLQKAFVLFASHESEEKIIIEDDEQTQIVHQKKRKNVALGVCFFILFLLLLPLLSTLFFSAVGGLSLLGAKNAFESGSFSSAKNNMTFAENVFSLAEKSEVVLAGEFQTVGLQDTIMPLENIVQTGSLLSESGVLCANGIEEILAVLEKKSTDASDLQKGVDDIRKGMNTFHTIDQSQLPSAAQAFLSKQKDAITLLDNTIDVLPTLLGAGRKKTYLVLFQNNAELRPGGGFIGSYGLVTVDKGSIVDFTVHDVYDADGQLKGHIEPPFPIRRYIPVVHMYLRDSNYSPDFTKNAAITASLFQQEMGQRVDGVIGIDLSYFKDIIGAVGGVYVPEYNQTITKDNFFLQAESHSEKNFFPGSSQKKDFLRSVFTALQKKFADGNVSYTNLFAASIHALQEKHILFGVSETSIQDVLTANGLSSSLWDARVQKENTINDFFSLSEANIGVNKVNFFVTRTVNQTTTIATNGAVLEDVKITFTNTSTGEWPGGAYKNYLRVYVPLGSQLTSITIDGNQQNIVPAVTNFMIYEKSGFVPPSGLEVENQQDSQKTYFGFLVNIQPLTTKTIDVSYQLAQQVNITAPVITYSMWVFKQAGIDDMPYSFSLSYPQSYALLNSSASYNADIRKDVQFTTSLTKK